MYVCMFCMYACMFSIVYIYNYNCMYAMHVCMYGCMHSMVSLTHTLSLSHTHTPVCMHACMYVLRLENCFSAYARRQTPENT